MRKFGIDLGTTNTCIYCAEFTPNYGMNEEDEDDFRLNPVSIRYENTGDMINPELSAIMPSAIYARPKKYSDKNEYDFYIGTIAMNLANQDHVAEIINTKRLICREDPSKKIEYGLTAQDIAQKLLEGCRYTIEKEFGKTRLKASRQCITRPAAFGLFASRSIHDAGKLAGFPQAEIQSEPIAALLSFLYEELRDDESAEKLLKKQAEKGNKLLTLVVDIGGGTTDVTIQEIQISGEKTRKQGDTTCTGYKINFINLVREGDGPAFTANLNPAFGGYDFDKEIVLNIVKEWDKQYYEAKNKPLDTQNKIIKDEIAFLYRRVQNYKNSLSRNQNSWTDTVRIDDISLETVWTPEKFYKWTKHLCISPDEKEENTRTVYGIICDTIKRSGYHVNDIDCFFVTGGMSSYKPVRDLISDKFKDLMNKSVLKFSETPLRDIAMGAALCNFYFEVKMPDNVLYADLMIDDPCGEPIVLVEKNTPLPAKGTLENFMVLRNPVYFYIDVLWGHNTKDCMLKRLRRLRKPIPDKTTSGKVTKIGTKISVEYEIDKNQAMNITLKVHDPLGEYTVPLLRLIETIDLTNGGELK